MAAKGAHITQNVENRPSIFEVVAADSLNSTFYPALRKIAYFLATSKPNVFGYLLKYYDETFVLCNCVVQSYYLRNKGGSLSELFYGLTRISTETTSFPLIKKRWSLVYLVLVPYLCNKLEQRLEQWKSDYENGDVVSDGRRILLRFIPYAKAFFEGVKLLQYLSYLAGKSSTHSLVLRSLKLTLTYQHEEGEFWTFKDALSGQVKLATMLSSVLLRCLELSAFFLQFIEWWQHEANMGDLSKLPLPEAPEDDCNTPKYKNICPLCLQKWMIPTALSVSGYVYCYRCIVTHIQQKTYCPVSEYPATISDLVRVFDDDE